MCVNICAAPKMLPWPATTARWDSRQKTGKKNWQQNKRFKLLLSFTNYQMCTECSRPAAGERNPWHDCGHSRQWRPSGRILLFSDLPKLFKVGITLRFGLDISCLQTGWNVKHLNWKKKNCCQIPFFNKRAILDVEWNIANPARLWGTN